MENLPYENPREEGFFRRWRNARRIGQIAKIFEVVAESAPPKPQPRDISYIALRASGNN